MYVRYVSGLNTRTGHLTQHRAVNGGPDEPGHDVKTRGNPAGNCSGR